MNGERKGIAIAGNVVTDIVKLVDMYPDKGNLCNVLSIQRAVGGCVPNTLISLAKIDPELPLTAYARIGNDDNGRYISGEMSKCGIDVSRIVISGDVTSFSDVMTVRGTGERTFFHMRGPNSEFSQADIDVDAMDCDMFHIAYILLLDALDAEDDEYGTKMARLLHDIQARGIRTSVDVVSEDSGRYKKLVPPALKYCNFLILNEIEACGVSGLEPYDADGRLNIDNLRATARMLMDFGVREKVVIHCPALGCCLDASGEFTVVPSLELPPDYIKGSVGAGDSFCAGCLYAIYNGWSDEEMLSFASAAAACNLSAPDSVSGMRSRDEVLALAASLPRKAL